MATMRNERFVWATAADLGWWYHQLKKLSVETEAALTAARADNTPSMLEIESLTDRCLFLDSEIGEVLDELDVRVASIGKRI